MMSSNTLGADHVHVYVTRAATLSYQELTCLPFEEARRELTRLLLGALPMRDVRRWAFTDGVHNLIAYVVPDGELLVVGSVSLAGGCTSSV